LKLFFYNLFIAFYTDLIIFSYQPPEHVIVYPSLEKLQEYAEKKGKEDLNDQATGDSQSLTAYLDQIKYDIIFILWELIHCYMFIHYLGQWRSEENL
jgi:hypothetical protein